MDKKYIDEYQKHNCKLMPLQGKRPIDKNWTDENYKQKSTVQLEKYENLGWILAETDIVIDVDERNGGLDSFVKLLADFNINLTPTVKTNGGFHCYYRIPKNTKLTPPKYAGIDWLGKGRQVVIAGSKGYEWLGNGFVVGDLPEPLLEQHTTAPVEQPNHDEDLPTVHTDTVEKLLESVNPDSNYETWLHIGMALHDWSDGLEHGLKLFEAWSKQGKKWEAGLCRKKWSSFKNSGVTIGTLLHLSKTAKIPTENETVNPWQNWYFVGMVGKYINANTNYLEDAKGLNIKMSPYVPLNRNGGRPSAEKFAIDNHLIRIVDSIAYLPTKPDKKIIKINGKRYFNIFNAELVPKPDEQYTERGKQSVEVIKNHLTILLGSQLNANLMTDWLAWQRQNMGKKLYWCPLIQSIEGLGKSFFGHLLRVILGDENLGIISPEQVVSNFNSWATSRAVNVLEELRLHGHNRYDAATALKPLISDKIIMVNEKNVRQYQTFNVANYLVLTNYRDALPITDTDRRYWIIFAPHKSIKEFELDAGDVSHIEYFKTLYSALRCDTGQIIKWLDEHPISNEFKNLIRAPDSDAKSQMIEIERSNIDGLVEIEQLVLEESPGRWVSDCVKSVDLFQEYEIREGRKLSNWAKNHIMLKLGFTIKRRVWTGVKTDLIWMKSDYTDDEVRTLLNTESTETASIIDDIIPF